MQMAATRGKLMELIAAVDRPRDKEYQDRAFMIGILSLLDVLLGIPMLEIVDELNAPDEVRLAVLERKGRLGRKLALIEAKEKNDVEAVQRILSEFAFMGLSDLTTAELEAASWANRIGETIH
jgi:EAL and modified HD-GYP domain-containing signal transduction protein